MSALFRNARSQKQRCQVIAVAAASVLTLAALNAPPAAAARPRCHGEVATLVGTQSADDLHGTARRDVIVGLGGSDQITGFDGEDILCGGTGQDQLIGGADADQLFGEEGSDALSGGSGEDSLSGGAGRDGLEGDDQADSISGGIGRDQIDGGDGGDRLDGDDGRDSLSGGRGTDRLRGGVGSDFLDGGTSGDNMSGGADGDFVSGGNGSDDVRGGAGDDDLHGERGEDTLSGGDGADRLEGDSSTKPADDALDGGEGSDTVVIFRGLKPSAPGIQVDLENGTSTGHGLDTLTSIESAHIESNTADVLIGSAADNTLYSGSGRDVERGLGGNDVFLSSNEDEPATRGSDRVLGGPGRDTVDYSDTFGNATVNLVSGVGQSASTGTDDLRDIENVVGSPFDDVLTGDDSRNVLRGLGGEDVLRGASGNDVLRGGTNPSVADRVDQLSGGPGDDLIDGYDLGLDPRFDTRDQVNFGSSDTAVSVDLLAGEATGEGNDVLRNVEDVVGSVHDDTLLGDAGSNELNGSAGDDVYDGREGDDELEGGLGDDSFAGGPGTDVLEFNLASTGVTADLTTGTASGQGSDTIEGVEDVTGSLFADQLRGDSGSNVIRGGFGDDELDGAGNADELRGERGDDRLSGGADADVLQPGVGDDVTAGGDGDDLIVGSVDTDHHDGGPGSDTIDYSNAGVGLDADLDAGTAEETWVDTVTAIENVIGTRFADRIAGTAGDNRLQGLDGVDELQGRAGRDFLLSGGFDRSKDFFAGGEGRDAVDYSLANSPVTVNLEAQVSEGDGNDLLIGIEDVIGSPFSDFIRGDEQRNVVHALGGDDSIELAGGDDFVDGGDGTDVADGGDGTDECLAEVVTSCE